MGERRKADKSKLSHASLASQAHVKRLNTEQLARLRTVERKALTGMAAVNYDCVLYDLDTNERANQRFVYGDGVGSPYMVSQITGAWSQVPDFLDSQHTIETRDDCEAYLARLDAFGRVMDEECERVRRDVGLGVIPPDFAIAGALAQMKVLHAPADKSTLVASLADRAKAKGIAGDWTRQATSLYEQKVLPALDRQMALMASLRPRRRTRRGVLAPAGRRGLRRARLAAAPPPP